MKSLTEFIKESIDISYKDYSNKEYEKYEYENDRYETPQNFTEEEIKEVAEYIESLNWEIDKFEVHNIENTNYAKRYPYASSKIEIIAKLPYSEPGYIWLEGKKRVLVSQPQITLSVLRLDDNSKRIKFKYHIKWQAEFKIKSNIRTSTIRNIILDGFNFTNKFELKSEDLRNIDNLRTI